MKVNVMLSVSAGAAPRATGAVGGPTRVWPQAPHPLEAVTYNVRLSWVTIRIKLNKTKLSIKQIMVQIFLDRTRKKTFTIYTK